MASAKVVNCFDAAGKRVYEIPRGPFLDRHWLTMVWRSFFSSMPEFRRRNNRCLLSFSP